ncbi:MAG TPA: hypothetical protein VJL61_12195 [Rhodanobacteraceae bacterium]|nr:hypothetical protein [Rhodanobacteraceae bacterium]
MTEDEPKQVIDACVVKLLEPTVEVSIDDVRRALADALKRIASLEKDREELGELFRMFNEQMDAAKAYRPGVLGEQ